MTKTPTPTPALPASVLDQLRQWRLQASLRFVGKSLRNSRPPSSRPAQAGK